MTLYILKYNNYYNRLVKQEADLDGYKKYLIYPQTDIGIIQFVNFNPNDGVNTQHVVGVGEYDGSGDYLIAVDDDDSIVSRWFIIDNVRTRAGQYQLTLRRDLVVDYYNVITQSPMFIEKAIITNSSDPALFNREGLTFNQIKQSESFLKDETNCPWIVGYLPETMVRANDYNGLILTFDYATDSKNFLEIDGLSNWDGYAFYTGSKQKSGFIEDFYYGYGVTVPAGEDNDYYVRKISNGNYSSLGNEYLPYNGYYFFKDNSALVAADVPVDPKYTQSTPLWNVYSTWLPSDRLSQNPGFKQLYTVAYANGSVSSSYLYQGAEAPQCKITNINSDTLKTLFKNYIDVEFDPTSFKNKYEGQLIKDTSTGLYYKVRVVKSQDIKYSKKWLTKDTEIFNYLNNNLSKQGSTINLGVVSGRSNITGSPTNYTYFASASFYTYSLNLEPIYQYAGVQLDSSVYELNDQPYFMFCAPYTNDVTVMNGSTIKYKFNKELAISLATQFAAKAGKDNVFDIQLLPFCPARYAVRAFIPTPGWNGTSGTGEYANVTTPYIFDEKLFSGLFQPIVKGTKTGSDPITLTTEEVGKVFWASSGNFSFDIDFEIPNKTTALDIKIASETELYRLCSPNYSGIFEFDPYMNGGIQTFNVDCSYKPFNPYIHINPNFKYLYGSDYNDQRGLIIQGDFSLPQETSAWSDYELRNKNYQAMFDRQIQNLKVNQDVQRKQQVFNAVTGSIGGGVGGAMAGSVGGPFGAIAGAMVGTAASSIGGALDVHYGDLLRNEALDYTKDMYNYNLGNIQALPSGMTKTSPLTANFKYFPFIEKYVCTPVEEQALRDKIAYNGMTVMRIGSMLEFITEDKNYIKGKLIRYMNDGEDYHVVNSISGELDKGVFISKWDFNQA